MVNYYKKEANLRKPLMILILLVYGCVDVKSKKILFLEKEVCNKLWIEKYLVFSGGAHSAELYSDYITDSTSFRIYIGSHDEYSSFEYKCKGDSVIVLQFKHQEDGFKIISKESALSLPRLKKESKFE